MDSRNAAFHDRGIAGILLAPVKWVCLSAALLLGLMLAAWIIDWIFVFRVWPEGLERLQSILTEDLAQLQHLGCWCDDLPRLAAGTANLIYSLLFRLTGVDEMGARFGDSAALSIPDSIVRKTYLYR